MNVLRLSLHRDGLAPRILNLGEWRNHILARLEHKVEQTADPILAALREELVALSGPKLGAPGTRPVRRTQEIAIPLPLRSDAGPLSFLTTTTIFGPAVAVTLSEVTIKAFFPADRETADRMAAHSASI